MRLSFRYLLVVGCIGLASFVFMGASVSSDTQDNESALIAKKDGKSGKKPVVKQRDITSEVKVQQRSTNVSFEDTDIAGERRGGLGSVIEEGQVDKEVDLIKIRYSWHPEMKSSTSSLETGKTE